MNPTKSNLYGIAAMKRTLIPAVLAAVAALAVAAPSAASADSCPNVAFRTDVAANLPDCRAYELVSKGDGDFGDVLRTLGSSDDGSKVAYDATGATELSHSSFLLSSTVSSRSDSGWTSVSSDPLTPQIIGGQPRIIQPLAVSSDSSKVLALVSGTLVPDDGDGFGEDLYLINVGTGVATFVSVGPTRPDTVAGALPVFVGASRDLSRIYFQMNEESLIEGVPPGSLYEWHNGGLTQVPGTFVAFPHARSSFDANYSGPNARLAHGGPHMVSDDGSTIFVFIGAGLDARRDDGTVVQVNASQRAGEPAVTRPEFVGASPDGNVVYFTTIDRLTENATPGGGLYRYELSSGDLELVTPDAGPGGLGVTDALISNDASHVYFVAKAALEPGAQAGQANVYLYNDGQTRFIAALPEGATVQRSSLDGRFAVIKSTGSLGNAVSNGHIMLYEYDDQSEQIGCVSCRSDGSPSQGDATVDDTGPAGLGSAPELSSPRNITNSGQVFFASRDQLVPGDVNQAWDVYEYSHGTVSLVSTGHSQYDSFLADNSDDGRDAFFITHSSLVPEDKDSGLADMYDARSEGGFPPEPATDTAPCGGGCQHPAGPPSLPDIGSVSFEGDGNVTGSPGNPSVHVSGPRTVIGTATTLRVRVPAAGAITLAGPSIVRAGKSTTKAATYPVKVLLNAKGKATLRKKRRFETRVTVTFEGKTGPSASESLKLNFERSNGGR